jgi:hypothetical protein
VVEIVEKSIIIEEKDISRDPRNKSMDMTIKIKTEKISQSLNEDIIQRSVSFLCP